MALEGKHQFGSIGDIRVSFAGKKIDEDRKNFLKKLLEVNGFEVIVQEEKRKTEEDPRLFTVGVTDMTFNPTVYIFQRRLKTIDGEHIVTKDYWEQMTDEANPQYWKI
jgi:hypothetical protein